MTVSEVARQEKQPPVNTGQLKPAGVEIGAALYAA